MEEVKSSALLTEYLTAHGFDVETGIAGLPTAFRAVYTQEEGGPSFGFLAEYDALKDIGHACGHHMQGPSVIGAALALRDIDLALMMHAAPSTCVDVRCMALEDYVVTFHGVESHAAMSPEKGKSAFDAALLSFQAIEFMREHIREDSRIHYTILDAGGPANIVPGRAVAEYTLRSYDTDYLEDVIVPRFRNIIKGACLMTDTTSELERSYPIKGKIPCLALNDLMMKNANEFQAPQIAGPREKTGSTDFGNVMYEVPGCCIRIAFVTEETSAHSQAYLDAGKSEKAHKALRFGALIMAGTCGDILEEPELLKQIQDEFAEKKGKKNRS